MLASLPAAGRLRCYALLISAGLNILLALLLSRSGECSGWSYPAYAHKPKSGKRLSHLVISLGSAHGEEALMQNLNRWRVYPPCSPPSSHSSSKYLSQHTDGWYRSQAKHLGHQVELLVMIKGPPGAAEGLEQRIRRKIEPYLHYGCFRQLNFHYHGGEDDLAELFHLNLRASRVMLMAPDCLPIRSYWLTLLDAQARAGDFWMSGAGYQGDVSHVNTLEAHHLLHLEGNALYDIADPAFRSFYLQQVKRTPGEPFYLAIFRHLLVEQAAHLAHHFQPSNFIKHYQHTNYTLKEVRRLSDYTLFVHGGTPLLN